MSLRPENTSTSRPGRAYKQRPPARSPGPRSCGATCRRVLAPVYRVLPRRIQHDTRDQNRCDETHEAEREARTAAMKRTCKQQGERGGGGAMVMEKTEKMMIKSSQSPAPTQRGCWHVGGPSVKPAWRHKHVTGPGLDGRLGSRNGYVSISMLICSSNLGSNSHG